MHSVFAAVLSFSTPSLVFSNPSMRLIKNYGLPFLMAALHILVICIFMICFTVDVSAASFVLVSLMSLCMFVLLILSKS